jgi:hypothetical protein
VYLFVVMNPATKVTSLGGGNSVGLDSSSVDIELKFERPIKNVRNERGGADLPDGDSAKASWTKNEAVVLSFEFAEPAAVEEPVAAVEVPEKPVEAKPAEETPAAPEPEAEKPAEAPAEQPQAATPKPMFPWGLAALGGAVLVALIVLSAAYGDLIDLYGLFRHGAVLFAYQTVLIIRPCYAKGPVHKRGPEFRFLFFVDRQSRDRSRRAYVSAKSALIFAVSYFRHQTRSPDTPYAALKHNRLKTVCYTNLHTVAAPYTSVFEFVLF